MLRLLAAQSEFREDRIAGGGTHSGVEGPHVRANSKVHRQESSRQGSRRLRLFLAGILIGECRGGFRGQGAIGSKLAPADGGKTMVRSDKDIGGCLDRGVRVEPVEQLLQTVIGILQSAPRGLAVDPRGKLLQASGPRVAKGG